MNDIAIILIVGGIVTAIFFGYYFNYNSDSKSRVKDLYAEGLDLLIAGKRKAAYHNFKEIIDKDSDNIKAYLRLGQVLREGGNPTQALKIHKGLIHRKSLSHYEKIELYKNISLDYFLSNNLNAAKEELFIILRLDKANEWALNQLVAIFQKQQKWSRASEYLEKYQKVANKIDHHKLALFKVQEGRSLTEEKKFKEARKTFEDALNINGDLAVAYYFIGNSYSAESEDAYQSSIADEPSFNMEDSDSNNQMKRAKDLLGKAIPMWIRYAELKPDRAWLVIHLLKDGLFALDRYHEIEDILKQILKKDNDNIEVIASLSEIYSHRGEDGDAMELIDSALEQDPSSLIVKLIKMKHSAKKEIHGNEFSKGLDELIHFLVTDERFQMYKNTATDKDIIWLYETSLDIENILL